MTSFKNPLGEESIPKLLLKFSVPATVGMMVNALYNIVDRIFIGNSQDLGSNGLAGITLGFPIMLLLLAIGVLFGIGGSSLFSIRLGEKKEDEASLILGNSLTLLIVAGLLYAIIGEAFIEPILMIFGANANTLPYAIEYMRIIFIGAAFQAVSMGMNNFIRADGNPKLAMLTMFLGAGCNIVLDPIFIYGLRLGMAGAALATVISQILSFTWVIHYFFSKQCRIKLKINNLKLNRQITLKIISLGIPGFLMQLSNSVLNIILNRTLISYGGDVAISGMGIVNSLQTLILMPVIGIRQGAQPIIGFNFGAKKFNRVKEAVKYAVLAGTAFITVAYILIMAYPEMLIRLFNSEQELVSFGRTALRAWFLVAPLIAFQVIGANFFQSIGRSKAATFLTLSRQVIFLIPAVIIFPMIWGLDGILYAGPFADFCSVVITAVMVYKAMSELKEDTLHTAIEN